VEQYVFKDVLSDETKFKKIDVGRVDYTTKKVQVVYNPTSGRRVNLKQMILSKMEARSIRTSIYETKGRLDAFNFMRNELEVDDCAAVLLVGGDGTFHEAINGLMNRPDRKKVPIGLIPNGSGNDTCFGVELKSFALAMDAIIKGIKIKVDLVKVMLDHNSEADLDAAIAQAESEGRNMRKIDFLRYSLINSSFCLLANVSKNCQWLKSKIGKNAYTVQSLIELSRKRRETMDLDLDDGQLVIKDLTT
jgi:diacylglycerol kinase family enzyme